MILSSVTLNHWGEELARVDSYKAMLYFVEENKAGYMSALL